MVASAKCPVKEGSSDKKKARKHQRSIDGHNKDKVVCQFCAIIISTNLGIGVSDIYSLAIRDMAKVKGKSSEVQHCVKVAEGYILYISVCV